MSIAAQNVSWVTSGPAFSNQVVALGGRDAIEDAYHGYVTFTGDASTTSVTVNWIDGTQTPFFTQANPPTAAAPKLVIAGAPNTAASQTAVSINVNTVSTTGCVLTFSAAPAAVAYTVPLIVFPYSS